MGQREVKGTAKGNEDRLSLSRPPSCLDLGGCCLPGPLASNSELGPSALLSKS